MFYFNDKDNTKQYDPAKFMEWEEVDTYRKVIGHGVYDEFNSYFITQLRLLTAAGEYHIVTPYRPDIYSNDIYQTTDNWQLLWYYNNLNSIEKLVQNYILYYPNINDVEQLYFTLQSTGVST